MTRRPRIGPFDILVVGVLAVLVGYLAAVARRGLDITDEGFYLLSARHPGDILYNVTSAHHYAGAVLRLLDYDVVAFRRLGIVALAASAAVLAGGLARAIGRRGGAAVDGAPVAGGIGYAALAAIGSLLYYGWFLPTPSYNLLNAIALNCALGLFFGALAPPLEAASGRPPAPAAGWRRRVAAFAAGVFLGAAFFVKFPTAVATLACLAGLSVLWPGRSPRRWPGEALARLGWLALGGTTWMALHFLLVMPPGVWWRGLVDGVAAAGVLEGDGRRAGVLLGRYRADLVTLARQALWLNLYPGLALAGVAAWLRLGRRGRRRHGWAAAAATAAIVLAAVLAYRRGLHLPQPDTLLNAARFHLGALALVALAALALAPAAGGRAAAGPDGPRRRRVALLAATLLMAPLLFSFGTNNPIGSFSALCLGGWFVLYAWLLGGLAVSRPGRRVAAAGLIYVLAFTCSQIVLGSYRRPYRLAGALGEQTVPTAVGSPATTLMLDAASSRFLSELRSILYANGFRPGGDLLNFHSLQGAIFAVGGKSPGLAWLAAGYPGSRAYAAAVLARVEPERLRRAFVLETPASAGDRPDLAPFGLNFPAAYVLCGELPLPYPWSDGWVRVWRPRRAASLGGAADLR